MAILVEALLATANQDTAAIPKRQAVAIRNRRTIPTTPSTIRVNMPNKPVPECPCPFSDTLTLPSTFLTEQDNEGYRQLPPTPALISRYPSPRLLAVFLTIVLMFRLPVRHSVSVFPACSRLTSSLTSFLFHMPLEL